MQRWCRSADGPSASWGNPESRPNPEASVTASRLCGAFAEAGDRFAFPSPLPIQLPREATMLASGFRRPLGFPSCAPNPRAKSAKSAKCLTQSRRERKDRRDPDAAPLTSYLSPLSRRTDEIDKIDEPPPQWHMPSLGLSCIIRRCRLPAHELPFGLPCAVRRLVVLLSRRREIPKLRNPEPPAPERGRLVRPVPSAQKSRAKSAMSAKYLTQRPNCGTSSLSPLPFHPGLPLSLPRRSGGTLFNNGAEGDAYK